MRTRLAGTLEKVGGSWKLTKGTFFWFLATNLGRIASEDIVGGIFSPKLGRPSTPPEHLVALLLLRYFENVSYQVAADRTKYDVRWKAVLGYDLAEEGPTVSATTLNDFEDELRWRGRHDVLVKRSIEMASEAGWIEAEVEVAQDSSPVLGKGADKDTYNLLGDAIRKLIRGIAKADGSKPLATATKYGVEELFRRSTKATAEIDWSSPEARRGFLQCLVEKAEELMALVDEREAWGTSPSVVEAVTIVRKIIFQDIERDEHGKISLRQGVAEDRLISVHDPEMRRGHKTQSEPFEGFKFHHTVDIEHGFVLATDVTSANTHDSEPSASMAERTEQMSGSIATKIIGDCAYGTEKNRVAHADAGRVLVAKLPRTPRGALYPKDRFTIDLQNKTVTCPQSVTTANFEIIRARNAEPGREVLPPNQRARWFVFPPESCSGCPQRIACVSEKHESRTIEVGPHEALFIEARAYQDTESYKQDRRARPIVERQVARRVRLGARLARVFGMAKVRAQIAMIAAVLNFTRLAKLQAAA
jgi:hypothetical protein